MGSVAVYPPACRSHGIAIGRGTFTPRQLIDQRGEVHRSLALERKQKKIAAAATSSILSPPEKQDGNSGQIGRMKRGDNLETTSIGFKSTGQSLWLRRRPRAFLGTQVRCSPKRLVDVGLRPRTHRVEQV